MLLGSLILSSGSNPTNCLIGMFTCGPVALYFSTPTAPKYFGSVDSFILFSFALLLPLFLKSYLLFGPTPGLCINPIVSAVCGIIMNSVIGILASAAACLIWSNFPLAFASPLAAFCFIVFHSVSMYSCHAAGLMLRKGVILSPPAALVFASCLGYCFKFVDVKMFGSAGFGLFPIALNSGLSNK